MDLFAPSGVEYEISAVETRQIDLQPRPFRGVPPFQHAGASSVRRTTRNSPGECAVPVAEADQFEQRAHDGALQMLAHFFAV